MKKASLFDVRTIVGALMTIYGVILVLVSFGTSDAEKAKSDDINANLWVGLALLVFGLGMLAWAISRPLVVDEEKLEADKRAVEEARNQSRVAAHQVVEGEGTTDTTEESPRDGTA